MSYTIKEAANKLGVTTVRIHGLLGDGRLTLSPEPREIGGRFVKTITVESIDAYLKARETRSEELAQRKLDKSARATNPRVPSGSKQYILTLSVDEATTLVSEGYVIRPRHQSASARLEAPALSPVDETVELGREEEFMADDDEDLLAAGVELATGDTNTHGDVALPDEQEQRRFVIRDEAAELLEADDQYDANGNYIPYNERETVR